MMSSYIRSTIDDFIDGGVKDQNPTAEVVREGFF